MFLAQCTYILQMIINHWILLIKSQKMTFCKTSFIISFQTIVITFAGSINTPVWRWSVRSTQKSSRWRVGGVQCKQTLSLCVCVFVSLCLCVYVSMCSVNTKSSWWRVGGVQCKQTLSLGVFVFLSLCLCGNVYICVCVRSTQKADCEESVEFNVNRHCRWSSHKAHSSAPGFVCTQLVLRVMNEEEYSVN